MDILASIIFVSIITYISYSYFNINNRKKKILKENKTQKIDQNRPILRRIKIENEIQRTEAKKVEKLHINKQELSIEKTNNNERVGKKIIKEFKNTFTIEKNSYLKKETIGYFHSDYQSGGNWQIDGTIENMIWTLKNDIKPFPLRIPKAIQRLDRILTEDLTQISWTSNFNKLTVCVVPRAKKDSHYRRDQLYFREITRNVVNKLPYFENGIDYIKRHTNTRTTHLRGNEGGDGEMPFIGITKKTCTISKEVFNRDILLIDDIYTKSINIDEDAIQALIDEGAKSVTFYAIGKTVSKSNIF